MAVVGESRRFFLTVKSPTPFFFSCSLGFVVCVGREEKRGSMCNLAFSCGCLKGVHFCIFFQEEISKPQLKKFRKWLLREGILNECEVKEEGVIIMNMKKSRSSF